MLKNILTSVLLSLVPLAPAYAIFGGVNVKESDQILLSTVGIYNAEKSYIVCSGVLLAENLILTAAHCLTPDRGNMRIFFGASVESGSIRRVVDGIRHPEYRDATTWTQAHDLAVLKIRGSIPAGSKPVKFLQNMETLENLSPTAIAGYGTMDIRDNIGMKVLRKTVLPIRDIRFSPSEISLFHIESGACEGDSGGPSYVYVGDEAYVWGIAQKVYAYPGQNSCSFASVYTRVDYYRDWIEKAARTLRRITP